MIPNYHDFDDNQQEPVVAFIRQYRPIVPAPAFDLQERIMSQLEPHQQRKKYRHLWLLVPAAIASALIFNLGQNRQLQPTLSQTDKNLIEASLVNNWLASSGEEIEDSSISSIFPRELQQNRE